MDLLFKRISAPIEVSYTEKHKFAFKEGYFFSNGNLFTRFDQDIRSTQKKIQFLCYVVCSVEPGLYSRGRYGIRLKNVLEVYDTGEHHPSGARFLGIRDISLVPFEPNMIDRGLLSLQEVRVKVKDVLDTYIYCTICTCHSFDIVNDLSENDICFFCFVRNRNDG